MCDHREIVTRVFEEQKVLARNADRKPIDLRAEIAKQLFGELSDEEQAQVEEKIEFHHKRAMQEFEEASTGLPSASPVVQKE